MDAAFENLQRFLTANEGPLAYVVLGASGAVEYLVPPFPGDLLAVFGIFLAVTAKYNLPLVYLMLNLGATLGGLASYALGRWLRSHPQRWPQLLHQGTGRRALDAILKRFERHGSVYLLVNRFVPVLRSLFFVGAGLAGLPLKQVAAMGFAGAALWNALLLAAGIFAGHNWRRVGILLQQYTLVSVGCLLLIAIVWWIKASRRSSAGRP